MAKFGKNRGFSLTEVLLSVGTLAIGMLFIAGVFPVGIHFTTVATEQTIAAVVADEAFAKIRIYAEGELNDLGDDIRLKELDENELRPDGAVDFNDIFPAMRDAEINEFLYPSDPTIGDSQKKYCWSALCRLTERYDAALNPNPPVQITVFVCRRTNPRLQYLDPAGNAVNWPKPVPVAVSQTAEDNELEIVNSAQQAFINDGCRIIDDRTGRIYRVLRRYPYPDDDTILLDRDWIDEDWDGSPSPAPQRVWVVPPPLMPGTGTSVSGRNPCIAVYQKVIRF